MARAENSLSRRGTYATDIQSGLANSFILTSPIYMPRCAKESSVVYAASHSHGRVPARGGSEVRAASEKMTGGYGYAALVMDGCSRIVADSVTSKAAICPGTRRLVIGREPGG